jgi:hypothetical protein
MHIASNGFAYPDHKPATRLGIKEGIKRGRSENLSGRKIKFPGNLGHVIIRNVIIPGDHFLHNRDQTCPVPSMFFHQFTDEM